LYELRALKNLDAPLCKDNYYAKAGARNMKLTDIMRPA